MKSFGENTHSFIVRFWLEPRERQDAVPEWRGMIEHVATGDRRCLKDLEGISFFITPYLKGMGAELSRIQQVWKWLKRRKPAAPWMHRAL